MPDKNYDELTSPAAVSRLPKVSILCITYNHRPYIRQWIDGVLQQEVGFGIEILIGEVGATDGIRDICLDLQRRHPDKVRLLLARGNSGIGPNLIRTFKACRGEYIAFCEGDDFWSDPLKLRKQIALLESRSDLAGCFHNVRIVCEDCGKDHGAYYEEPPGDSFAQADLVLKNVIPTCSSFFRNKLFDDFPEWYEGCPCRDWVLHVLNAAQGRYQYMDEVMGAYRIHGGGVWGSICSMTPEHDIARMSATIRTFELFIKLYGSRYRKTLLKEISRTCFHLAVALRKEVQWRRFWSVVWRGLLSDPGAATGFIRVMAPALIPSRRRRYERAAMVRRQRGPAAEKPL